MGKLITANSLDWQTSWIVYSCVTLAIGITTSILIPPQNELEYVDATYMYFQQQEQLSYNERKALLANQRRRVVSTVECIEIEDPSHSGGAAGGGDGSSDGRPQSGSQTPDLWEQLIDWRYLLPTCMAVVLNIRTFFFLATEVKQVSAVNNDSGSNSVSYPDDRDPVVATFRTFINAAIPIGGITAIPLAAWILSANKMRYDRVFGLVLFVALVQMVLNLCDSIWAQYAATAFFVVLRSLNW